MENIIVVAILLAIVAGIIIYLVRAKKRGDACIGCPHGKQCGGGCNKDTDHHFTDRND